MGRCETLFANRLIPLDMNQEFYKVEPLHAHSSLEICHIVSEDGPKVLRKKGLEEYYPDGVSDYGDATRFAEITHYSPATKTFAVRILGEDFWRLLREDGKAADLGKYSYIGPEVNGYRPVKERERAGIGWPWSLIGRGKQIMPYGGRLFLKLRDFATLEGELFGNPDSLSPIFLIFNTPEGQKPFYTLYDQKRRDEEWYNHRYSSVEVLDGERKIYKIRDLQEPYMESAYQVHGRHGAMPMNLRADQVKLVTLLSEQECLWGQCQDQTRIRLIDREMRFTLSGTTDPQRLYLAGKVLLNFFDDQHFTAYKIESGRLIPTTLAGYPTRIDLQNKEMDLELFAGGTVTMPFHDAEKYLLENFKNPVAVPVVALPNEVSPQIMVAESGTPYEKTEEPLLSIYMIAKCNDGDFGHGVFRYTGIRNRIKDYTSDQKVVFLKTKRGTQSGKGRIFVAEVSNPEKYSYRNVQSVEMPDKLLEAVESCGKQYLSFLNPPIISTVSNLPEALLEVIRKEKAQQEAQEQEREVQKIEVEEASETLAQQPDEQENLIEAIINPDRFHVWGEGKISTEYDDLLSKYINQRDLNVRECLENSLVNFINAQEVDRFLICKDYFTKIEGFDYDKMLDAVTDKLSSGGEIASIYATLRDQRSQRMKELESQLRKLILLKIQQSAPAITDL